MNFKQVISILNENILPKSFRKICSYEALNYVSSEDIITPINVPSVRTSMRDGYGIVFDNESSSSSFNATYNIINKSLAGHTLTYLSNELLNREEFLENNYAIYIATGAQVPDIINAIIMVEDVTMIDSNNRFTICEKEKQAIKNNQYIREIGSDIKTGSCVIKNGKLLNESSIGLLAMLGINEVQVYEKPKIGILSSGDEIVNPFNLESIDKLINEVYDSNRYVFMNYLKTLYGNEYCNYIKDYGIIKDDLCETGIKINSILQEVDILITSGGISMGEKDYIKPIMKNMGTVLIEKTSMKPGKPFLFTRVNYLNHQESKYVFSLPGNPVSSGVTYKMFVEPFIKKSYSENSDNLLSFMPLKMEAILRDNIKADKTRFEFIRGNAFYSKKYDKVVVDLTTSNHNSSNLASMIDANCLICVNPNCDLYIGNRVNIFMLSGVKSIDETLNIGIITASDRAYSGIYEDKSGLEIQKYIINVVNGEKTKYKIFYKLVNDDREKIKGAMLELCDNLCCNLIFTTGGTGPDKRDVTDLVTAEVCEKMLPGFGEIMRMKNFEHVPTSILSGQTAGIRYIKEDKGCLIVNLPGKPEAINDCLQIIFKSIPKCLNIIYANDLFLN